MGFNKGCPLNILYERGDGLMGSLILPYILPSSMHVSRKEHLLGIMNIRSILNFRKTCKTSLGMVETKHNLQYNIIMREIMCK